MRRCSCRWELRRVFGHGLTWKSDWPRTSGRLLLCKDLGCFDSLICFEVMEMGQVDPCYRLTSHLKHNQQKTYTSSEMYSHVGVCRSWRWIVRDFLNRYASAISIHVVSFVVSPGIRAPVGQLLEVAVLDVIIRTVGSRGWCRSSCTPYN